MKQIIFVIGTGRSGTHLLGRIIESHPQIRAYIEHPPFFELVTKMATDPKSKPDLFAKLVTSYNKEFNKVTQPYILEKSHPNLWLVDDLIQVYPNSYFYGIVRGLYSTVASMLNHGGVMMWYETLNLTKPNKFLGITQENCHEFAHYPIEIKCAHRWLSHSQELERLRKKYPNVHQLEYEAVLDSTSQQLELIASQLGIENLFAPEPFYENNQTKWKETLTVQQYEALENFATTVDSDLTV